MTTTVRNGNIISADLNVKAGEGVQCGLSHSASEAITPECAAAGTDELLDAAGVEG